MAEAQSSGDSIDHDTHDSTSPTQVFMAGGWGTLRDAAAYLGHVSTLTLRREIKRGRLRAYKVGGRKLLRLKRTDCDRFIEAQQIAVVVKS